MSKTILELSKVSKSFISAGEELQIINNLDLLITSASKTSIIGESGCGKSTLLNIIGGLESPTKGTIQAGPYSVHNLSEKKLTLYRGQFLGLVFQFHYLLKDFSALENVMLPAFMSGMKKKEAMEKARALLVDVGLEQRMHHFPSRMSGGERQRAAVARALINTPSLVLADEPTGNLDPANADLVREILFTVVSRYNNTLILATHDLDMAACADTCYRLQNGQLVLQ
ncbi:MAG TPA: ABC transporter ATP-binding protein [Treponemataceae bacterium]|nr:ABC transporter ATP-binding protein [Treponemataceae bacterium]